MDDDEPCRCMRSHASISPMHDGHCCFWPPTRTCHTEEFVAWSVDESRRVTDPTNGGQL